MSSLLMPKSNDIQWSPYQSSSLEKKLSNQTTDKLQTVQKTIQETIQETIQKNATHINWANTNTDPQGNIISKIDFILDNIKKYDTNNEVKTRDDMFYEVVELALSIFWNKYIQNDCIDNIIDTYLEYINIEYTILKDKDLFINRSHSSIRSILYRIIVTENHEKKKEKQMRDINEWYVSKTILSPTEIFDAFDDRYNGSMGFLIISENGDRTVTKYRCSNDVTISGEQWIQTISVDIFWKLHVYKFILIKNNGVFSNSSIQELDNFIRPNIKSLIFLIESALYLNTRNSLLLLTDNEKIVPYTNIGIIDTRIHAAILRCVETLANKELINHPHFIEDLIIAYELSRKFIYFLYQADEEVKNKLIKEIGLKLDKKVFKRNILNMVTTMLRSQNETASGHGYPFGKKNIDIPIEWRIYQLIRAHEIISSSKKPWESQQEMDRLQKIWFFDQKIFEILSKLLNHHVKKYDSWKVSHDIYITQKYTELYETYIEKWTQLMKISKDIGTHLERYRSLSMNNSSKREEKIWTIKTLGELQDKLTQIIGRSQIMILMRHSPTESDRLKIYGPDNESISPEVWVLDATEKWDSLKYLHINNIYTSDAIRARETAHIICNRINNCDVLCKYCPNITTEKGLENPSKDSITRYRWKDWALSVMIDYKNWELPELMDKILSWLYEDEIIVMITHRTPAEAILKIFGYKVDGKEAKVRHGSPIIPLLLQWDTLIERENMLFFPIFWWQEILEKINTLAQKIFWGVFFVPIENKINPLQLHNNFLDFCDAQIQNNPDQFRQFVEKLKADPSTRYFIKVIRENGIAIKRNSFLFKEFRRYSEVINDLFN